MATLEEIRSEIVDIVPDDRFEEDWLNDKINKGIALCAKLVLLPDLEVEEEVETVVGSPEVDIPEDWNYSRGIYYAEVDEDSAIKVLGSLSLLLRHYPNAKTELLSGDIEYITVVNRKIFYYPIPDTIKTIKVKFYKKPDVLEADSDEVTCIPEEQVIDILRSYVLWQMYIKIEDGAEGNIANTIRYRNDFMSFIQILNETFDQGQSYVEVDRTHGWV